MYEKTWDGKPQYIELEKDKPLTIVFTKLEVGSDVTVMVTGKLGEQRVPLSPKTFMGDDDAITAEGLTTLGMKLTSLDEDEFAYAYMPDGSVVMNATYFDAKGLWAKTESVSKLVALPNSYVSNMQFMCNCSAKGLTFNFNDCQPWDASINGKSKSLSVGAIAGIVVGCVVVVAAIVAGVAIVLRKKTAQGGLQEPIDA